MLKAIAIIGSIVAGSNAHGITLNEYLSQVEKQSLAYQQGRAQAEGSGLVVREADLLTSPYFFAEGRQSFDRSVPPPPQSPSYDQSNKSLVSAGISQQFSFGLQAKFAYSLVKTKYDNASFSAGVESSFWDANPSVELTMPLWANGFGRGVKAQQELTKNQNLADQYNNLANSQNLLIQAESTYWQLSSAQERVKVQEQALKAGQNIYTFVDKQKQKNLGESADVLQASALIESYKLQLQQAVNEEARLKRAFNLYLNQSADTNVPSLELINYASLENIQIPETRPGERLDVTASRAQAALAKANSDVILERNKPTLNLVGGYALHGHGAAFSNSFEDARKADHDSGYVGVAFQMPLNFAAVSDAKAGARRLKDSADLSVQNLAYTQEQDWFDLKQRIQETKSTLKLASSMEIAQRAKLANERTRLRQGRTTTYQVLLFEQDYSTAQASRILAASQIIALQSQLKLYQATPAGDK